MSAPTPGPTPNPAPPTDKVQARRDDLLAMTALLVGIGVAFTGRHVMIELAAGIALASGGVLLAVRGGRRIQGRTWMVLALVTVTFAALSANALIIYEEWQTGQWLAEGAPTGAAVDEIRTLHRSLAAARAACIGGALAFLLGALVTKLSGNEKGPPARG